jgi:glycopeptide antibiotics resistance protein
MKHLRYYVGGIEDVRQMKMIKKWWGPVGILLFLLYGAGMLFGTLGIRGRSGLEWVDLLVPSGKMHTWLVYLLHNHQPVIFDRLLNLADIVVNLSLFFPLGLVIGWIWPHRRAATIHPRLLFTIGLTLLISIPIEWAQAHVPNRVSDPGDVIANVGGAVCGCYLPYFWTQFRMYLRQGLSTASTR